MVRCAILLSLELPPNSSRLVAICYRELDIRQNHLLKPIRANAYLPSGCYVLRSIVAGDQKLIWVTNVSDTTVNIHKGVPKAKIGQQRVGPFEAKAITALNAYKLKLPAH